MLLLLCLYLAVNVTGSLNELIDISQPSCSRVMCVVRSQELDGVSNKLIKEKMKSVVHEKTHSPARREQHLQELQQKLKMVNNHAENKQTYYNMHTHKDLPHVIFKSKSDKRLV